MAKLHEKSIIAFDDWLETPPGRYVLGWEQTCLDAMTRDIFGFNAIQIGVPKLHALRENRMSHQWFMGCKPVSDHAHMPHHLPNKVVLTRDALDFPFASQSVDLVVLPHILEFSTEPHRVLREVERVLIPEGHLIICGFNPASLWGVRQALGRMLGSPFLPQNIELISLLRLKDWLSLLSMEVSRGRFGAYAWPSMSAQWFERGPFLEKAGDRWWPYFGAVYIVQAKKRVRGMTLVGPAFVKQKNPPRHAISVAGRAKKFPGDDE